MLPRFLAAAALSVLPLSLAAQITVNGGGSYTTIQAAVNAANNGDTVSVPIATYTENITITGKSVTLQTAGAVSSTTFPTINGGGLGPAISIIGTAAGNTTVRGFNITNAGKPQSSAGPQGAVYVSNASPGLLGLFINASFCAGVNANNSNLLIADGTITGITTTGCAAGEGLGSGIVINGADPAAASAASASVLINQMVIYGNTASAAASSDKGGGAAINITNQSSVAIQLSTLRNNTSTGYGGAIYIATTPQMSLVDNVIYGNKGLSGGLDIVVPGSSVGPPVGFLTGNTIAFNTATSSNAGSDIYIGGNLAQYQLVDNLIYGNGAGQYAVNCGVTYAGQTITPLVFDHNDIYSDPTTTNKPVGGSCTSPAGTFGNISADPLFASASAAAVAAGTANLQVKQGSPVIDTGNNSAFPVAPFDILTADRFYDGTRKGVAVIDMGAYEYGASATGAVPVNYTLTLSTLNYTPTTGSTLALDATFQPLGATGYGLAGQAVTFYEDGVNIGTANILTTGSGTNVNYYAPFTVANITAGLHTFYATYNSGAPYAPDTSVYIYVLVKAPTLLNTTTTLTYTPLSPTVSDTVTLTAKVIATTGAIPAGKIVFIDGSVTLGTSTLVNGTATYSGTFTYGSHSLVAAFVPADTSTYNGSSGTATLNVTGAVATAVLSVSPTTGTVYGSPITLTGTVTGGMGTPAGSVTFYVDGTALGAFPLTGGIATTTVSTLPGGTHTVTCSYSGDTTYAGVACSPPVTVTVSLGASTTTLISSLSPAQALAPFTVSAHVFDASNNPIAGAAVTLHQSGASDQLLTTDSTGLARFTVASPVSSVTFQAVTAASTSYSTSNASLTVGINPNSTTGTLIAAPTTAFEGDNVSVVVSILNTSSSVTAAGSVAVYDGTTLLSTKQLPVSVVGQTLTSVTFPVSTLAAGTHTLNAVYNPTPNFLGNTIAGTSVTINPSSFTLTADPSITIQTEHHKLLNLAVTSTGNFSGNIALSFLGALPPVLTPTFARNPLALPANGSVSTTVNLETDAISNFYALLPFALLPFALRKRHRKLMLAAIITLAAMIPLSGCSGHYPDHTPPGSYDLALQATGTSPSGHTVTQVVHVKLVVTP